MSVLLSSMKTLVTGIMSKFSNKAYFQTENGSRLHVQFNPEQFRITRTTEYSSSQQKEQPYVEFSGIMVPQLEISFFFDTSGVTEMSGVGSTIESDVTVLTNEFASLLDVRADLQRPPIVKFVWGSICFPGFLKQASFTYTMFNKGGMPVRALVDAHVMGVPQVASSRIPLESPDRTKARTVSDEAGIWRLADTEYGDISRWRDIARANGIMDPFDIPSGTVLKVPAL